MPGRTSRVRAEAGQRGELRAQSYLSSRGLKLVERNYRCRGGEVDLVMLDPGPEDTEVLAFIEVRLRGAGALVGGIESIDRHKRQRLVRAARHFLAERSEFDEHACRFDVVAIDDEADQIEWISGAFELDSI